LVSRTKKNLATLAKAVKSVYLVAQNDPASGVMEIVPIDPELIQQISTVRIYIPNDLRSSDNRKGVFKSIQVKIWIKLNEAV
jgi:hypothetical protein